MSNENRSRPQSQPENIGSSLWNGLTFIYSALFAAVAIAWSIHIIDVGSQQIPLWVLIVTGVMLCVAAVLAKLSGNYKGIVAGSCVICGILFLLFLLPYMEFNPGDTSQDKMFVMLLSMLPYLPIVAGLLSIVSSMDFDAKKNCAITCETDLNVPKEKVLKAFQLKAVDKLGYPSMEFEDWYQQGMSCYMAHLPKWLKKQAFDFLVKKWESKGHVVEMWHIRAFLYGASGFDDSGQRNKYVPESFSWPTLPPSGWSAVICSYPDGACDFDFVHPVSRKFWSEENVFLHLPPDPRNIFQRYWFEEMGFDVIVMSPTMLVTESVVRKHLHLV